MFFWFIGTAALSVWFIFRDEKFDYRVLALGAIVPDMVDVFSGGAWVFHSVLSSVFLLLVVMLATRRGTIGRGRWLALPIGTFMHLVFDGAFTNTKVFWWPFSGLDFGGAPLPSLDRLFLDIPLEIAGLAMLWWLWREHGLNEKEAQKKFKSTGRLVAHHKGDVGEC